MNLSETFLTALDSITANKLRSVLTMLGVIIGVASVIGLLAIGGGVTESISSDINAIGTNIITVAPDLDNSGGYPSLSMEDVEALENSLEATAIENVAASINGNQSVIVGGESLQTTVAGVTADYLELNGLAAYQLGDGLTERDLESSARVAVLGADAAADLFGESSYPIGDSVKINGVSYEVVGVLDSDDQNETVYIPLTTAQSRLFTARTRSGERAVSTITVAATSEETTDAALAQITVILRDQHDIGVGEEDDFTLISQTQLLEIFDSVMGTLNLFLGSIAAISLLVGGIGIMNIMLVSVTERTREIGIRKAIGAKRFDILFQFLQESMLLSLLGGALGILLGFAIAEGAEFFFDFAMVVAPSTVALAAGFAAIVGLVFGIYPAWRASSLRPIEALRYE